MGTGFFCMPSHPSLAANPIRIPTLTQITTQERELTVTQEHDKSLFVLCQ